MTKLSSHYVSLDQHLLWSKDIHKAQTRLVGLLTTSQWVYGKNSPECKAVCKALTTIEMLRADLRDVFERQGYEQAGIYRSATASDQDAKGLKFGRKCGRLLPVEFHRVMVASLQKFEQKLSAMRTTLDAAFGRHNAFARAAELTEMAFCTLRTKLDAAAHREHGETWAEVKAQQFTQAEG